MRRRRRTHLAFADEDPQQWEIELQPPVRAQCRVDGKNAFEDKRNLKWYPVAPRKERPVTPPSGAWPRYLWFKLEREPTLSVAHTVNALARYGVGKKKTQFSNTRREDDEIQNDRHKRDPVSITFANGPRACCDRMGDGWRNLNNEYYLCHALVYAILDKAEALVNQPTDGAVHTAIEALGARSDGACDKAPSEPRRGKNNLRDAPALHRSEAASAGDRRTRHRPYSPTAPSSHLTS